MFTIIHMTDIHGVSHLISEISDEITRADMVIISGDITHFGDRKEAEKIISIILGFNPCVFAVPGNCDYPGVENYLVENGMNLHLMQKEFKDFTFLGIGGSIPCPGPTPYEYTEEQAHKWLDRFSDSNSRNLPLIFVSHQPPYQTTADSLPDGTHVGSRSIRHFIELARPLICLTGHIHEGIGVDTYAETIIVNPGPFRTGRYSRVEINNNEKVNIDLKQIAVTDY